MQPTKLQLLHILSVLATSSAMAIVPRALPEAPHLQRDHGDPFLLVPSPNVQTTSTTTPAPWNTPAPDMMPTSSSTPLTIAPTTTAASIATSTFSQSSQSTSIATIPTSSSTHLTVSSTSSAFTSSSSAFSSVMSVTITATPAPTAVAIAPPNTSTTSSSQLTTLITLCILSLILGLIGLIIFVLAFLRRQARRKRARGMKREVELLKVDVETAVPGSANAVGIAGQSRQAVGVGGGRAGGKWEEAGAKGEGDDEWELEGGREGEEALPPYCR